MATKQIKARLAYLRKELRAGSMSYGELSELQDLAPHIPADDVELLEAAGVPEHPPEPETWKADECADASGHTSIRVADGSENGDTGTVIATVYADHAVALIESAPELLAVCKEIHASLSGPLGIVMPKPHRLALEAVIAIAEGR